MGASLTTIITGLTVGTSYSIDLTPASITEGTANSLEVVAIEI